MSIIDKIANQIKKGVLASTDQEWFIILYPDNEVVDLNPKELNDIAKEVLSGKTKGVIIEDNIIERGSWRLIIKEPSVMNKNIDSPKYDSVKDKLKKGGHIKRSILNRILLANKNIEFAIKNDIYGDTDFGSTVDRYLVFTKEIRVKNQFVYVEYKQSAWGGGMEVVKERYNMNKDWDEEALRHDIRYIISSIKKGAKSESIEVPTFEYGGFVFGQELK